MALVTRPALASLLEATDEGVVARAMRSRFPWRCTVNNSCFTCTLILRIYVNHTYHTAYLQPVPFIVFYCCVIIRAAINLSRGFMLMGINPSRHNQRRGFPLITASFPAGLCSVNIVTLTPPPCGGGATSQLHVLTGSDISSGQRQVIQHVCGKHGN